MTAPTPEQVRVATGALRTEATTWDTQSGRLTGIGGTVEGLFLARLAAGIFQLIVEPYDELVRLVGDRCRGGARATSEIGTALRHVADVYDAEDAAAEHRIRQLY